MAISLFDHQLVVQRIKTQAGFIKRVSGAAEIAAASDDLKQVPAAFVVPNSERPTGSSVGTSVVSQSNMVRFGVVMAVQNLRDPSGEKAQEDLLTVREAIMNALHGWQPSEDFDPIEFGGGRLLSLTDQVLWWQDDFLTSHFIRSI